MRNSKVPQGTEFHCEHCCPPHFKRMVAKMISNTGKKLIGLLKPVLKSRENYNFQKRIEL